MSGILCSETDEDRLLLTRKDIAMPSALDGNCACGHEAHLQQFLERAPIRCIELIAKYLDFTSFSNVFSANSSLLRLSYSSALQPCWTHFALVQRILRHGENVLIPSLTAEPVQLVASDICNKGYGGGRRGLAYEIGAKVSPSQTFCRRLPRVTRQDFIRAGSLNLAWRLQNFVSEHRGLLTGSEPLDKVAVLPAPPLACTANSYSVSPDSELSVKVCSSPSTPSCLQVLGASPLEDGAFFLTLLGCKRVIVIHATAAFIKGPRDAKFPHFPASIPVDPYPLLKTGCNFSKGRDDLGSPSKPLLNGPPAEGDYRGGESKRSFKYQRHQQAHQLLLNWVNIGTHPLLPAGISGSHRSADRLSRPALRGAETQVYVDLQNTASPPSPQNALQGDNLSHQYTADESRTAGINTWDNCSGNRITPCPAVRLLCICMPPIAVAEGRRTEQTSVVNEFPEHRDRDGMLQLPKGKRVEGKDEPLHANAGLQDCNIDALEDPTSHAVLSSCNKGDVADENGVYRGCNASNTGESTGASANHDGSSENICKNITRGGPSPLHTETFSNSAQMRIWPVALCTYSNEGARFVPQAVVCCALEADEVLKSVCARLWFRAKKDSDSTSDAGETFGSTVQPVSATRASGVPRRGKAVCLTLHQYPHAHFVGMVAVGTSQGRIMCTPPPHCLYRQCLCEREYPENPVDSVPSTESPLFKSQDVNQAMVRQGEGEHSRMPQPLPQPGRINSKVFDFEAVAAKAGNDVFFQRVGEFEEDGNAVDFLEIVWGTPWASEKLRPRDDSKLFSHVHEKTSAWHWTKHPKCVSSHKQCASCGDEGEAPCGGVEAEALWIIACSKQSGIKVFRFLWGCRKFAQEAETMLRDSSSCQHSQKAADIYGEWRCVLTIKGQCEMVSVDLPSGIFALCTPVDSRVYFLCFKHLLPGNIFYPVEYSLVHADISTRGLQGFHLFHWPKPQLVPVGGYVSREPQHLLPWLQVPQECSWHELLVPRRPSYLVPLGGRRWVIIVGSVIRVVKITTSESSTRKTQQSRGVKGSGASASRPVLSQSQERNGRAPMLEWLRPTPCAPALNVLRLCVFSHTRDIYQCAFDGVRRMVTIDLSETLVVWDMQKHVKLFGLELTKPPTSGLNEVLSGRSRHKDRGTNDMSDGTGDMSDDICSDQDTLGIVWSTKHNKNNDGCLASGVNGKPGSFVSLRQCRKGVKNSVKKQCSSGWMHMQVRAHHKSLDVPVSSKITVGGMRFSQSTLESALELQLLYDCQGGTHGKRMPSTERRNAAEESAVSTLEAPKRQPKQRDCTSDESPSSTQTQEDNSEALSETAARLSYADNFPSLGFPEGGTESETGHSGFKNRVLDAGISSCRNRNGKTDCEPSSSLHSTRSHCRSYSPQLNHSASPLVNSKGSSGRLSFAEVAAAAAASYSSNGKASQVGWALEPTGAAHLSEAVGEEAAQALVQISKSLGVSPEELLAHQLDEWSRFTRDSRSVATDSRTAKSKKDFDEQIACAELSHSEDLTPGRVVMECGSKLRVQDFAFSDTEPNRDISQGNEPDTRCTIGTDAMTKTSGQRCLESQNDVKVLRRHTHSAVCGRRDFQQGCSMVGLLGLQKSFFPLGPNSQHRRVSSVCLSETCLALLFKDLKTWQVWTFSPLASPAVSKKAAKAARLHEL